MKIESSEVYLISPIQLRNLEVEKYARNRDNAYDGLEELAHLTREQKEAAYDTLKAVSYTHLTLPTNREV